ncbi:MAG: hypothetical protein QNK37_18800 [Acidobacteriota bacterium]|nr:hypothetical protein [Acidobacteriota bacterium]
MLLMKGALTGLTAVGLMIGSLAATYFGGDDENTKKVVWVSKTVDGSSQIKLKINGETLEFTGDHMEVGDEQTMNTEDGTEVKITRLENGYKLQFGDQELNIADHGGNVFVHSTDGGVELHSTHVILHEEGDHDGRHVFVHHADGHGEAHDGQHGFFIDEDGKKTKIVVKSGSNFSWVTDTGDEEHGEHGVVVITETGVEKHVELGDDNSWTTLVTEEGMTGKKVQIRKVGADSEDGQGFAYVINTGDGDIDVHETHGMSLIADAETNVVISGLDELDEETRARIVEALQDAGVTKNISFNKDLIRKLKSGQALTEELIFSETDEDGKVKVRVFTPKKGKKSGVKVIQKKKDEDQ